MQDILAAIAVAMPSELDTIVQRVTVLWGKGALSDDEFSTLYGAAHRRRADLRGEGPEPDVPIYRIPRRGRVFPYKPVQRTLDRQRSLERRRTLAASGPLPPRLAAHFTTSQAAVLRIVADEVRERGACDRSLDEIAARAGVSRTLCRNALRLAERIGLLSIEVRPRPGQKHDTNLVRIISAEWRAWIEYGPKPKPIGRKNVNTTATAIKTGREKRSWQSHSPHTRRDSQKAPGGPPERDPPWGGFVGEG